MVEEYMGFEKFDFIKDNAALFEGAEQEQLRMQIQQDLQAQVSQPSMEERSLDQDLEGMQESMPE